MKTWGRIIAICAALTCLAAPYEGPFPFGFSLAGLMRAVADEEASCSYEGIPDKYDSMMRKAVRRYWSAERRHDWCVLKALVWTESDFRERVCSSAGACGLAQFVEGTWREAAAEIGMSNARRTDAKASLRAAAWYLERLNDKWIWDRNDDCRMNLALASYNAGFGNVLKAQRVSGMTKCWYDDVRGGLEDVTGPKHSRETLDYVDRVRGREELLKES